LHKLHVKGEEDNERISRKLRDQNSTTVCALTMPVPSLDKGEGRRYRSLGPFIEDVTIQGRGS